jgi:hypothetical protein
MSLDCVSIEMDVCVQDFDCFLVLLCIFTISSFIYNHKVGLRLKMEKHGFMGFHFVLFWFLF